MRNLGNKPSEWVASFNCAIEGILWAAKTQKHMLSHLVCAVLVLWIALILKVTILEFALLAFAVTLVLFAELMNTALEVVVDLVSPEVHPLARRAKDVAAGAVLVASIGAGVMGYLALAPYFFGGERHPGVAVMSTPGHLGVVATLVVILLIVLIKARIGRGTPLHGGMPSGHAGVAFSVATSVAFSNVGFLVAMLAWALAALVAQSRILMGIHDFKEVAAGSLLGITITLVLHLWFG